jgi:hypothetical protein
MAERENSRKIADRLTADALMKVAAKLEQKEQFEKAVEFAEEAHKYAEPGTESWYDIANRLRGLRLRLQKGPTAGRLLRRAFASSEPEF